MSIGELPTAPSPAARCVRALGCGIVGALLAALLTFLAWPLLDVADWPGTGMDSVVPLIAGFLVLGTLLTWGLLRWAKVRPAWAVAALGLALFLVNRLAEGMVTVIVGVSPVRVPALSFLLDSIGGLLVHLGLSCVAAAALSDRRLSAGAKTAAVLACLLTAVLAALV
ncbi:hypothetical protein ACFQZ4_44825 [Catellatospora coxensis]|uniref:Uncharacterized protein n=1 Tax=Catellatospora coxensis TaxID=310354 RepID=A0A8J3P563_9ACTN|nr:hypothetical protein [Catellatospora coxensis]GIG04067.1 hypothetical protein Cco03nite_07670 [Catellatospora coxensis]